ncbi:hypothetical protein MATL_G00140240 [Megalops atlanticus]|uniref:MHC class I antigen n=1 Tax=Megalops atlanticus TaxID=7932 RepID=A0A9D3T3M2_MEGAT|nr:hypothetical protein MATL_G00140240 [Megalops atlanticus]
MLLGAANLLTVTIVSIGVTDTEYLYTARDGGETGLFFPGSRVWREAERNEETLKTEEEKKRGWISLVQLRGDHCFECWILER